MPIAYHIRFRTRDNRVIATSDVARRRLARSFLTIGRDFGLLVFNAPASHAHATTCDDRKAAGEFARRVEISATQALHIDCGFLPAYIAPIRDQHHLRSTFKYILNQQDHHGLHTDPFHEASNLPDLLGLRTIGVYTAGLAREYLPQTSRADLLQILGLPDLQPGPARLDQLLAAAESALALPSLRGTSGQAVHARTAAIMVGMESFTQAAIAQTLRIPLRSLRRLRAHELPAGLLHAVRLQLALRSMLPSPPLFAAEPLRGYAA